MVTHDTESGLAEQAGLLLGSELVRFEAIAGGDLAVVVAVELADGRTVIAKGGPSPAAEAEMLAAIRATGAAAPAVLAHDESVLVLERLPDGGTLADSWHDLGANLAKLHARHDGEAPYDRTRRYGWHRDYAFGSVEIENTSSSDWPSFWAERRLLNPLPGIAFEIAARVETLARDLASRLPAEPVPSLLHGDLWSGNILSAGGRVTGLIDPACYFGHSEVDFAMLGLFSQLDPSLFAAYGVLAEGHDERQPIYQLWPALVHLRLFGPSYLPLVERLLAASGV